MPSNRFGGSGRYYHGNSDSRNKVGHPSPFSKRNDPKPVKDDKIKIENPVLKSPDMNRPTPVVPEKFKPAEDSNATGDNQAAKMPFHERKFTQRSRLFIGNLPLDMTEEEFKKLFSSFGEISETFVNADKGFGFVRLDTRANAEKAKWELDGMALKGRQLRVRFATHGAALSVKNISPHVSNELLEEAFSQFGQVERAVVIVDDRGRSTERGIVEFARKSSATKALQQIRDGCFLLTTSPRALLVSPLDQEDSEDGLPERNLQKGPNYFQEREAPPRFATTGTFEEEFARRWKALDDLEKHQRDQLEKNIQSAREKLEMEMENAIHEHRNMLMKQELMRRQEELQRLEDARKRELERRQQLEIQREEARKKEMEDLQLKQDLLRAQIDGGYKGEPNLGFRGGLPRPGYSGRPNSPPNPGMLRDALAAREMMSGQGGLGPAPSRFDQNRPMMGGRPGTNPPMSQQVGMDRGYGPPPPNPGQRRSYGEMDYDGPKRRRY